MFLLFLNVAVTVIYYNKCSVNKTIQQPVDAVKTYLKPAMYLLLFSFSSFPVFSCWFLGVD